MAIQRKGLVIIWVSFAVTGTGSPESRGQCNHKTFKTFWSEICSGHSTG